MGKAEELLVAHQEYQNNLHEFKDWLEQQQEKLSCYTQLEGDVDSLEETLHELQVREQKHTNFLFAPPNGTYSSTIFSNDKYIHNNYIIYNYK